MAEIVTRPKYLHWKIYKHCSKHQKSLGCRITHGKDQAQVETLHGSGGTVQQEGAVSTSSNNHTSQQEQFTNELQFITGALPESKFYDANFFFKKGR